MTQDSAPEDYQVKSFDPAVLATLTSGIMLAASFSDVQEAAEHVMGHPVWTHQFPVLLPRIRDLVLAQYPNMPTAVEAGKFEAARDAVRARYGKAIEVQRGNETGIHPLDPSGFPESMRERLSDATVIVVEMEPTDA